MLPTNAPRPVRRTRRAAGATALLVAGLAPLLGPAPAGATPIPTPAPLVTTDGIGVRVDEAVFAPVVAGTEATLQPFVDQALHDAAADMVPPSIVTSIDVTTDVGLGLDLIDAGTTGYPDGGVEAQAAIEKVEIHYLFDQWWLPTCDLWVIPDDATTARASAAIDRGLLPDSPLPFAVTAGDWDSDPDIVTLGSCSSYLPYGFQDLFVNGVSDVIEAEVTAEVQDLVDGIWDDHVSPVLDGLPGGFDLDLDQVRTDDHGLIVTADTDATGGLTIPGLGGPYSVASALGAWVPSTIDDLLANREDGAIVTIHPNVANQYLYALTQALSGQFGTLPVSAAIEDLLLKPGVHGSYDDGGWTVGMSMVGSTTAPSAHPTGPDGAPELRYELIDLTVSNTSYTTGPVATFRGSITDTFDPGTATVSLSLQDGNPDVVTWDPDPAVMTPYARDAVAAFASVFTGYPSLGPTALGALTWCPTCTRDPGDQRYTATLLL